MGAHVLIGFAEALSAPEVIFSLLGAGHRVSVFTRAHTRPPLVARLPIVRTHSITAPETDLDAARANLSAIFSASDAPDVVLAIDDVALSLVDQTMSGPTTMTPRLASATGPAAAIALDKIAQIEHARAAGLAVPETVIVRAPDDLARVATFPAIAKPALAIEARDRRILKGSTTYLPDAGARDALASRLETPSSPILVQPLVAGAGEGVFGFATPTGIVNWSGHRRLRMMNPHGSGSSACVTAQPDRDLRAACEAFITRIGWRGPFMIELLRGPDGTAYFMELNGRMWGSMALARRAGFEYPAWAVAQALDPGFVPPPVAEPAEPVMVRHLGRDLLHLLFVMRGTTSSFHKAQWPRIAPTLRAVVRPGRARNFYNYDAAHPRFFLREAADVVARTVRDKTMSKA